MAQDHETTTPRPQVRPELPGQRHDEVDGDPSRVAQELLAEHVPLALLVDLVAPVVSSDEILQAEGLPDDAWWEPEAEAPSR